MLDFSLVNHLSVCLNKMLLSTPYPRNCCKCIEQTSTIRLILCPQRTLRPIIIYGITFTVLWTCVNSCIWIELFVLKPIFVTPFPCMVLVDQEMFADRGYKGIIYGHIFQEWGRGRVLAFRSGVDERSFEIPSCVKRYQISTSPRKVLPDGLTY